MKKQEQFIDSSSEAKLKKLGFERVTEIGDPYENLSCGYRARYKNNPTGIHLFPLFESAGDNTLYFDYTGGRLAIKSVEQLKKLIAALTPFNFTGYYDDNNRQIFVGDKLKSEWGYEVIVIKSDNDYSGKLVCDENNSCRNIPYHLNKGKGHIKV